MKISPEQLSTHLDSGLSSVYIISGDEPLLLTEAVDAVREAAAREGYTSRDVYHVERNFDWQQITAAADSLSLFAERRIIEVRLPTGRPGTEGGKVLEAYAERPAEDTLLIIVTGKLDGSITRTKWYKAVDKAGVAVTVWPLSGAQFLDWLEQRLRQQGLQAERDAIVLLAERIEGNLLAAVQEIEKLRLLHGEGTVTLDDVEQSVTDSSRFDPFKLVDAALAADAPRAARVLSGMREEGIHPLPILGAVARELRVLTKLTWLKEQQGMAAMTRAMDADRSIFYKRKPLIKKALQRLQRAQCERLMCQAARVDRVSKGAAMGNPWEELLQLCLGIAQSR